MSISRDEWNSGRSKGTIEEQILTFLKIDRNKAYTLLQISQAIGYDRPINDFWTFLGGMASYWLVQSALETLMKEGKVKAKVIKKQAGDETYYITT